jgi:hypothetical protein
MFDNIVWDFVGLGACLYGIYLFYSNYKLEKRVEQLEKKLEAQ